ncbi:polysialyltransferase family glycosyltransferase [Wenzhouxiangella sp. EGI_FJ10409]|uniref:polysialyltransferase family glycosyltransferase n=1 Tax=Wenzhouxiangella sp. EGI_FJ10409 TaxID=3243767 RepID=UPI0035DCA314
MSDAVVVIASRVYGPEAFSELPVADGVSHWHLEPAPTRNETAPFRLAKRFFRPFREAAASRRVIHRADLTAVGTLILGHSRDPLHRHLANTIRHDRCVLVDDGAQILNVFEELKAGSFHQVHRPFHRALLDRVAGLRDRRIPPVELFTAYEPTQSDLPVIENRYRMTRRQIGNEMRVNDEVWIIGQYFHQTGMMSEIDYFGMLASVAAQYNGTSRVRYIMHPRESYCDSLSILSRAGVEPIRLKSAVELEIIARRTRPQRIVTFYSSVFQTCMKIFGDQIPFDIIDPASESWNDPDTRALVEPAYRYLKSRAVDPHRLLHPRLVDGGYRCLIAA